ncbi:hypothetical protein ACTG9Q_23425 [Actinokineospora sp. 24-640]
MDELGQVVATHRVDTDRRTAIGGWGIALGVLALVIAANLAGEVGDAASAGRQALGGAIGLALSAFAIGGWHLAKRALLPGERFVVRERGLVHVTDRRDVVVPWAAVVHARVQVGHVHSPIAHYFGSQCWVALKVRGRRGRVRFSGLTEGYDRLLESVLHHCPPAPGRSVRARWTWAGVAVASAGTGLALGLGIDDDMTDTGALFTAIGLVVCFVLAVTGVVLAVRRN